MDREDPTTIPGYVEEDEKEEPVKEKILLVEAPIGDATVMVEDEG